MSPLVIVFALLPVLSTFLGGLAVFRLRHRLHPVMAVAAGILVATALVDLLPEALELITTSESALVAGIAALVGFLAFSAVESFVHRGSYEHEHEPGVDPHLPHEHAPGTASNGSRLRLLGPLGLVVHSGLDGVAIGLGFAASVEVGVVVGLAVMAHDFADGINITTLTLESGLGRRTAIVILALDAVAAPIGAAIGISLGVTADVLGILLAAFAGVFIAIGAGHLLPEAQHQRPLQAPPLVLLAAVGAAGVLAIRLVAGP
ncbi:MAG TPA: ZIP family metal transporter [Candidatus Limnocylindrales bacterium]|jgi:ZIP family zinc transporter